MYALALGVEGFESLEQSLAIVQDLKVVGRADLSQLVPIEYSKEQALIGRSKLERTLLSA